MSKQSARRPWDEKWETVQDLSGGGQGTTQIVRAKGSDESSEKFVLKILKSQRSEDRRAKMFKEVASLQAISHPLVPRCVDSNAHEFKNLSVPLYLVTEYVEGPTLEQFVDTKGAPGFSLGLEVMRGLLDVLDHCHTRDTVHRDIKPDNIVLRSGNCSQPVLLDFGLSFNELLHEAAPATPSSEQLGNRFLALPELLVPGGFRADPRSDLTQACGILFYLITGKRPVTLLNETGLRPHERNYVLSAIGALAPDQKRVAISVFEQGFNQHIDFRFQSVVALRDALFSETTTAASDNMSAGDIRQIVLPRPNFAHRTLVLSLFRKLDEVLRHVVRGITEELGGSSEWTVAQTGYELDPASGVFKNMFGFHPALYPKMFFSASLQAVVSATELVLSMVSWSDGPVPVETPLMRLPLNGDKDWNSIGESIKNYYMSGIGRVAAKGTAE